MEYTLAAAAEVSGVAKTTLFRAIKSGRLSARRLDDKTYRIDASELARVYPPVPTQRPDATLGNVPQREKRPKNAGTAQASEVELAVLRTKLEAAEDQLGRERETVDDLRRRLDQEQEERRSLQRQLAPPIQPAPQPAPESSAMVEELRRRHQEAEARNQVLSAVVAPQWREERPSEPPAGVTPAKGARGFLGRLLGR